MFCFVICKHFTTLKWLTVLKLNTICLKIIKATDQIIWFLNEGIRINLHCRCNECGIKLQILINNYPCINLLSKGHLRPWYAKRKMSMDDSSQKIGRNMYLQGTVMHSFSTGKCIEKRKMLPNHSLTKRPHSHHYAF